MRRIPVPSSRLHPREAPSSSSRTADVPSRERKGIPLKDVLSSRRLSKGTGIVKPGIKPPAGVASSADGGGGRGAQGEDNIKVCVRIRPTNEREERHSTTPAWTWKDNTIAQTSSSLRNRSTGGVFTYDHLFNPLSDTEEIYESAVRRVILATMGGYHG